MADSPITQKSCTICGQVKAISDFYWRPPYNGRAGRYRGDCKACFGIRRDKYQRLNADKLSKARKKWVENNVDKVRANRRRHYEENRERLIAEQIERDKKRGEPRLAKRRIWVKKNRDKVREAQRRSDLRHRDARVAYKSKWLKENSERTRVYARNRRARKQAAGGSHSVDDIRNIREVQRDKCAACRCNLKSKGEVDHIIPLARGGTNDAGNLQLLCRPCNRRKHAKDPETFMRELGRLL
jgi:5-methylcytosine-specific restriction endonuclease McrA